MIIIFCQSLLLLMGALVKAVCCSGHRYATAWWSRLEEFHAYALPTKFISWQWLMILYSQVTCILYHGLLLAWMVAERKVMIFFIRKQIRNLQLDKLNKNNPMVQSWKLVQYYTSFIHGFLFFLHGTFSH